MTHVLARRERLRSYRSFPHISHDVCDSRCVIHAPMCMLLVLMNSVDIAVDGASSQYRYGHE